MLAEFAPSSVFAPFAATPPHFTAPFRLMHAAGPVEVLLVAVFIYAIFALPQSNLLLAPSLHHSGHVILQFFDLLSLLSILLFSLLK